MFDHEKLDVYRVSIDFAGFAFRLIDELPRGGGTVADQLRRAAMSVSLNIAEACGRPSVRDRARYFAMARGSAMECAAVLDIIGLGPDANPRALEQGRAMLHRVVSMLTRLCF